MRIYKFIATLLIALLCSISIVAQEIVVNVTPVQQVLPPQVLLYINDPGKYFNISLTNTGAEAQQVYLALHMEQTAPASDLSITTPPKRQPKTPFTIQPNSTYQLTTVEMKKLFNHIPANEISCPVNLFADYESGSFGLLPEGYYKIHINAYKWNETPAANPLAMSNPAGGIATFRVCYNAQAPQILTPMLIGTENSEIADLDPLFAQFTWSAPVIPCASDFSSYTYDFKVVELTPGQQPDYAMDNNPIAFQATSLVVPSCVIPTNIITNKFYADKTYVACVTAKSSKNAAMSYVQIENNGKSNYRQFRIKTSKGNDDDDDDDDDDNNKTGGGSSNDDDDSGKGYFKLLGNVDVTDSICADSLYTFRNPKITSPTFLSIAARKHLMSKPLKMSWDNVFFIGGEGQRADTLKFAYKLELFNNGGTADKEATLQGKPIYTKYFDEHSTQLSDSIPWDSLKNITKDGDYMVLRIVPECVNGKSVAFTGDQNIVDFAIAEQLSRKYFECSNMVEISNKEPIKAKADELKGKTISIGEYQLTLDDISSAGENTWKGKGRIEWNPMGTTVMVCVKFSDLKINSDYAVYEGTATTYAESTIGDSQVVDSLFSDWGIDNLIADTGIPYAEYLQSSATGAVKDLAKKIDISKYYSYVKKGGVVCDLIGKGDVDELYFPVALPEEINSTPVDIQISSMKFSAEYATMDLIGEFTLPGSNYLKNDILIFGAPRLCVSPDKIIPEGGTLALLSDFTILDPKSSYEMTFNAPENVLKPNDGCYIAWKDYSLELLGLDVEMKIPGLKKEVAGKVTDEMPVLKIKTSIGSWDDWMVDQVTIDPFQAEDMPGWTFTAEDIVYDHSSYRNSTHMGKFPDAYDKEKSLTVGDIDSWQGLYIKKVGVKMPEALEFGESSDKRCSISAEEMFIDKSGATLMVGAKNILSATTGKAGGWSFSLDKVNLEFIQNNFNYCNFSGKFDVPLVEGTVGYECRIINLGDSTKSKAGDYAYIFKTQQIDNINFDFILAEADIDKNLTYLLLEAEPEGEKLKTKVELLMGGTLTIGGTDYLQDKVNDLGLSFSIPGIHFAKMRIANCDLWESKYEKELQNGKDNAEILMELCKNKQFKVGDNFYFNSGDWSLASRPESDDQAFTQNSEETLYATHGPSPYAPARAEEKKSVASQSLGPFNFSLDDYKFDFEGNGMKLYLEGTVKLIEGIDLSATAGLSIKSKITGISGEIDFSKIGIEYDCLEFNKAAFNSSFAGMTLKGELNVASGGDARGKGYSGSLKFTMPGDLFTVDANGGYFELEDYTWGYFNILLGSSAGVRFDPVVLNEIKGGFYFNCVKKSDTEATPKKGIIGVIAGMKLSTSAGENTLNGSFEMTVAYDNENDRLSTFIFTGGIKVIGGLVDSKASIVYQHDESDEYFSLNITVDTGIDGVSDIIGEEQLGDLESKLKELNSEAESIVTGVTAGLSDFADASDSEADSDTKKEAEKKKEEAQKSTSMKVGGVSIQLDFKVTTKAEGKELPKAKWHVYIGEPAEDKRCTFTWIDFKSPIVSVNIGANAYLCLGNELPGDGELPPIPEKIQQFLDGSTKGSGVQSDDMSKANKARTEALANFKAQVNGGLMLGASMWGYVDVDLGLFYGEMGAIAGFDMSLRHLSNASCMNISRTPGYNGWYGEGQLYAYLYAKFGLKIDLGFWDTRLDILDAGIGGVLRMGGPNPTYFTGAARVKLRLLSGLVSINRRFEFECGDVCDVFYGNALDNFELLGDCSIGDTIKSNGWNKDNAINSEIASLPKFYTQATVDEHFRVLDETELNILARDYEGDKENLKAQASRTFVFHAMPFVSLIEYKSEDDENPTTRIFALKRSERTEHIMNIKELNPGCYYKLIVGGYAMELYDGIEDDPLKWDEEAHEYKRVPWYQEKEYYFCTKDEEAIEDCPNLEEYVAIAYPSYFNKLKTESGIQKAYIKDINNPNIALRKNLQGKCYNDGKLEWQLYTVRSSGAKSGLINTKDNINIVYELKQKSENQWVVTDSTCNMQPKEKFTDIEENERYLLKLVYLKSSVKRIKSPITPELSTTTLSRRTTVTYETKNVIVVDTTTLAHMELKAVDGNWRTGYKLADGSRINLEYEKPFIGACIEEVEFDYKDIDNWDDITLSLYSCPKNDKGELLRLNDPYIYLSYLSNYAFVGGYKLTNSRLGCMATTSQSLIYTDNGGVYEGFCAKSKALAYGIVNGVSKIRDISIYDKKQWQRYAQYPLPVPSDPRYSYMQDGLERICEYIPASNSRDNYRNITESLGAIYSVARNMDALCTAYAQEVQELGGNQYNGSNVDKVKQWAENRTGTYATFASTYGAMAQVPYYQFAVLWGSQFRNSGDAKAINMWASFDAFDSDDDARPQEDLCENIWYSFIGGELDYETYYNGQLTKIVPACRYNYKGKREAMTKAILQCYRVNAYDFNKKEYVVNHGGELRSGNTWGRSLLNQPLIEQ